MGSKAVAIARHVLYSVAAVISHHIPWGVTMQCACKHNLATVLTKLLRPHPSLQMGSTASLLLCPPQEPQCYHYPFNEQVVKYSSSSSFNSTQGLPPPSYFVAHLKDLPCHHPNLLPLKPQGWIFFILIPRLYPGLPLSSPLVVHLRPPLYPPILFPEKSRGEYSSFTFLWFCSRFTSDFMSYCAPRGPSMSSPNFFRPSKPQRWISFILIPSFSAQSRCFEGNTFHSTSFPDCRPHLPHKANPFSLKKTG